ncbi:MAG: hypothetical protein GXP47_02785 [Acidobacteria bacterium]|nr:hypothetical protein [Acidobacteriota bacterium]
MIRHATVPFLTCLLVLTIPLAVPAVEDAPPVQAEVWVQQESGLTLTLRADGQYSFSGPGISSAGRYQVQGSRIGFQDAANGTTTVYTMVPAGNGVVALVDSQGNRLVFRLQGAPGPAGGGGAAGPVAGAPGPGQTMVLVQRGGQIMLTLRGDDTYRLEGAGFQSEGPFEVSGTRLVLHDAATGTATTYTMAPGADGTILLVDPKGDRLAMELRQAPAGVAPAPPAPAGAAATAGVPPPGSPGFLLWFLVSLPRMQPDQVYQAYVAGLSEDDRLMVSIMEGLNSYIFQVMCTGSHAAELRYNGATGAGAGCAQILADAQQALAYGGGNEYAEQQRQEMIIHEKCKLGLIDAGSCGAYRNTQRQIARDSARTTQTIVGNMAPPPCTQYFTPDGLFVGCW